MMGSSIRLSRALLLTVLAGGLCLAPGAFAVDAPVTVSVAVSGTPGFGATVTAKATVTITDGSSLQSILWSQTVGATAALAGTTTDTVTVTLGSRNAYRNYLIHVLAEPPIGPDQLPPNVPPPPAEDFPGGLQDRFEVVGINPFALEEAGDVALDVKVVTTSGTYHGEGDIAVSLPWATTTAIRNVAVGIPVVLYAKTQASYNWAMTVPSGSSATLTDPTSQSPEFTPDVAGTYQLTVTDLSDSSTVTIPVIAGTWRGIIVGEDADGRPKVDTACTGCHAPGTILDLFTPWKNTGHAEIFTDNLDTSTHYSESCLVCHTVGYDTAASNNGIDDQPDWQAFLDSGMLHHAEPDNWANMLAQFPKSAKLANIQCENCHGPQNSTAHYSGTGARATLSAEMCGSCHGEPARHGRYQQWQLSGHADYEVADSEGMSGTCAECHTANGFLAWQDSGFTASSVAVTWTQDEIHPQTCQTCHDPHDIGTTSGGPETNAKVRIMGTTPPLKAGFTATDVGKGAICMTCHNSRRGLTNDSTYSSSKAAQAPHVGTQADILMGQNLYFVTTGTRSYHSRVEDACVACHMEKTPPPAALSYELGGTNHTFYASPDICSQCHVDIVAADVQGPVHTKLTTLKAAIEGAILDSMKAQIQSGKKIDLGGERTVSNAGDLKQIDFGDTHGQQGITVTLADNSQVGPLAMGSVNVVSGSGTSVALYSLMDQSVPKAAWNYLTIETDGSFGVHNPTFVKQALDVAIYAASHANPNPGATTTPGIGGGPGNGAGAVSCTSPYVYWAELVGHLPGLNNSQWRTDMVARNLSSDQASLRFVLHLATGNVEATGTVPGDGQGVFEDLVSLLGVTNDKGALEICSDQPLLVAGRIFNQAESGTFGQFIDGHVANLGLNAGDFGTLLELRQETDKYRTNISVTNGGTTTAQVAITLYDTDGIQLTNYTLSVDSGKVVQDVEPFVQKANRPDVGWGFATVNVLSGSNILASASVVDAKTNDPTTIPLKQ